jgi:taurine dioxygenase
MPSARYGVIFFRDQDLSPEQHIAFAKRWGEIEINRFFRPVEGYPMIAEVRKEPEQKQNIGSTWHTDHSYDQAPAMGSILYAREVPEVGGDTLFANMCLAYETFSEGLKETLAGLRAWHSSRHVFGHGGSARDLQRDARIGNPELATQDALHPVVIRHPTTGRKALYVNASFTYASTAGPRRNPSRFWTSSTAMRRGPSSPAASAGRRVRSPSGTTGPPGTMPSTTMPGSAA